MTKSKNQVTNSKYFMTNQYLFMTKNVSKTILLHKMTQLLFLFKKRDIF